jgi:hypothetical protein
MKWKNGVAGQRCGPCSSRFRKVWKAKNRDKYREWSWRQRGIDITLAKYHALYRQQDGRCAVCREERPKLTVDHCHKTGRIRGLLCYRCNQLAQDPGIVRAILKYMEEGGEQTEWIPQAQLEL